MALVAMAMSAEFLEESPAEVLDAFDDDLYVIKLVDGP